MTLVKTSDKKGLWWWDDSDRKIVTYGSWSGAEFVVHQN